MCFRDGGPGSHGQKGSLQWMRSVNQARDPFSEIRGLLLRLEQITGIVFTLEFILSCSIFNKSAIRADTILVLRIAHALQRAGHTPGAQTRTVPRCLCPGTSEVFKISPLIKRGDPPA